MGWHKDLAGENLHGSKFQNGSGNPNGVITSTVIGDTYYDITNKKVYVASAANSNLDWVDVVGESVTVVGVNSIYGRDGNVLATSGDYNANLINYDDTITLFNETNIQGAIEQLNNKISSTSASISAAMNWRNQWVPEYYNTNDVVYDDGWTMVANKGTYDRPAPQADGEPSYIYPDDVNEWETITSAAVIITGHKYIFNRSGWLKRLRVWVPNLTDTTNYRFILIDETDPSTPIREVIQDPILIEDNWATITVGERIVTSGSVIKILIDALDSGSNTVVNGGWTFNGLSFLGPATSGTCNRDWGHRRVRINKIDLDGTDRESELLSVIPDSTIRIAETAEINNYLEYSVLDEPIDNGSYVTYETTLINEGEDRPSTGVTSTIDITIPIANTTRSVYYPNAFISAISADYADITGILEFNGINQPGVSANGYGVDLQFQAAAVSEDWDLLAHSEIIGGGNSSFLANQNYISFNTDYTSAGNPTWKEGLLFYDYTNKTLAMYNDQSDVTLQIGQEGHIRVFNNTGSTILNGKAVEITSGTGDIPIVSLALATIENQRRLIGVTTHDIPNNSTGLATVYGTVGDINTSAFSICDTLYLSNITPGEFMSAPPISPYPTIKVGHLISCDVNGKILVNIDEQPLTTPFEKVLYVTTSGTDSSAVDGTELKPYKTINYALSTITDNSSSIRYVILVGPGLYNEVNPLQMKEYVHVKAIGGPTATRIVATVAEQPLILGTARSELSEVALQHSSAFCCEMNEARSFRLSNVTFTNSKGWIKLNNVDGFMTIDDARFVTTPTTGIATDIGIKLDSGVIRMNNITIASVVSATKCFDVSGANSRLEVKVFDSDSTNITTVFDCNNKGELNVANFDIRNCDNTVILATSAYAHLFNGYIKDCSTSILVDDSKAEVFGIACDDCIVDLSATPGATIIGSGNGFRTDRLFIFEDTDITLAHVSDLPGDKSFGVKGELHVGTPEQPKESIFGEGDSYIQDILIYYGNTTSAIEDISVEAASFENSTFAPTSANIVDQCLYTASDKQSNNDHLQHFGIKLQVDTSGSGGIFIPEYWNGTNWIHTHNMFTDSSNQYFPHAELTSAIAPINVQSYQVRYDQKIETLWEKNDPIGSGINRYWIRWRLTKVYDNIPLFQQIKLHSNRFEINSDGWIEYFGKARPIAKLPWDAGLVEAAAASPTDQDVYLSDTLDVGRRENEFADSAVDRMGFLSPLPYDCDTSTPINLQWSHFSYDPGGAAGGNAVWNVRWGYLTDGGLVYGSTADAPTSHVTQQEISFTSAVPVINTLQHLSVNLDISDMKSRIENGFGDTLFVTIEREGTNPADSATYHSVLVGIGGYYTKWCEGGHH